MPWWLTEGLAKEQIRLGEQAKTRLKLIHCSGELAHNSNKA